MSPQLVIPAPDQLAEYHQVLADWQSDATGVQLHPGDLGWLHRSGAQATAAALRIWLDAGTVVALGMVDGPGLVRLTVAPDHYTDPDLATQLVSDLADPEGSQVGTGPLTVEAPQGSAVRQAALSSGWQLDEAWAPLQRDLTDPVPDSGLQIEQITTPARAAAWSELSFAAFGNQGSPDPQRWAQLNSGPHFERARFLTAHDQTGAEVAMCAVWSAGPGRPGLLEPLGTHPDHRGRGYGRGMCLAAAAALRSLGASSMLVNTPAANTGAVATYRSAGFVPGPELRDLYLAR